MTTPNKAFLQHVISLYENFNDLPLKISIDARTFTVSLMGKACEFYLYPKFLISNPNYTCYTQKLSSDVLGFSGWLHYRRPPCSEQTQQFLANKVQTKKALAQLGVRIPEWSKQADNNISPVIVKKARSSFAANMRGPFKTMTEYPNVDPSTDFYEQFIEGNIIKIWFWRQSPVLLESQPMPTILGNGAQTVEQLIRIRGGYDQDFLYEDRISEVLSYYQQTRDTVLADGEELIVDYRYASMLADPLTIYEFHFPLIGYPKIQQQVDQYSTVIWSLFGIKPEEDIIYTVDAILTEDEELYILEINTNPEVHPYLYQYIAKSIAERIPT